MSEKAEECLDLVLGCICVFFTVVGFGITIYGMANNFDYYVAFGNCMVAGGAILLIALTLGLFDVFEQSTEESSECENKDGAANE